MGRSVLVEYNTKCLEGLNFEQDVLQSLAMGWVREFDCDLTLHVLLICNKNTIAILHGHRLAPTPAVKEFVVKRKKNKNEVSRGIGRWGPLRYVRARRPWCGSLKRSTPYFSGTATRSWRLTSWG